MGKLTNWLSYKKPKKKEEETQEITQEIPITPHKLIKNPFISSKITGISMNMTTGFMGESRRYWGYVEFKNGDTEGKQRFEAEDLALLFYDIIEFCNTL